MEQGLLSTRPVKVSFKQHIQYLLPYSDKRFERHHSFMFVVFNILQKRNVCFNARLMVSNPYYKNAANQIQQLISQDILKALGNIAKNTYSSEANPNLNTLLKQIKTVGGKVMGSPQSRAALRTEIHSLIYSQGLPSILMTINPTDVHSPIALYFAGVNLNIDHILTDSFPSTFHRAQIVALHPVAAAKFFNLLITNILETLVKGDVLGPIKAHYGTVETQGRGSLHLHVLLWLDHNMTPSQLKENIKDPKFKERLIEYLEDVIKEDLDQFRREDDSTTTQEDEEFAAKYHHYPPCRPPPPYPWDYCYNISRHNFAEFKKQVCSCVTPIFCPHDHNYVNSVLPITCDYHTMFPSPLKNVQESTIVHWQETTINAETGQIKMKRSHETINNFNEFIIVACRSNMDIKFIWSGSDAKALVYYITDYVTKTSLSAHDTFSLVHKAMKSIDKHTTSGATDDLHERSRKLVLRCYNTIASQQELSGVQVASYLMNWHDHYTSHKFENLFLIGIESYLEKSLHEKRNSEVTTANSTTMDVSYTEENVNVKEVETNDLNEQFSIGQTNIPNNYALVNMRIDYQYRPSEITETCLYDFIGMYRKKKVDKTDKTYFDSQAESKQSGSQIKKRGPQPNQRLKFKENHPQYESHILIQRTGTVVPVLIGPQIPRKDREDTKERYARAILILFLPWRGVDDLCQAGITKDRDEHLIQVIEQTKAADDNIDSVYIPKNFARDDLSEMDDSEDLVALLEFNYDMTSELSEPDPQTMKPNDAYIHDAILSIKQTGRFSRSTNDKQDQLLMCIPGPGGTGKSQLIHAITEYFSTTKRSHELRKLAPTSNAAAQIDGLTIHSFTSYRNLKKISGVQRTTIEKEWQHIRYIIINEMSMVGLYLLGQLGGLLTLAKHCGPSIPSGDINVIFFEDFIQYDPVGDQALYSDIISDKTQKKKKIKEIRAATCALGRALWEQINTVVKLEKQMRTSDSRYLQLLQRLRKGECTVDDHELLTTRVIDPNHDVKSLDT
ncbi:unnamed protein product, partial [Didymodactylos carnosus]